MTSLHFASKYYSAWWKVTMMKNNVSEMEREVSGSGVVQLWQVLALFDTITITITITDHHQQSSSRFDGMFPPGQNPTMVGICQSHASARLARSTDQFAFKLLQTFRWGILFTREKPPLLLGPCRARGNRWRCSWWWWWSWWWYGGTMMILMIMIWV